MRVLGIESSSLATSVALVTDDILTAEYIVGFKKTYSQTLFPMPDEIAKFLDPDLGTLDAITVTDGLGSSIGLHIGATTVKGLGLVFKKSLIHTLTVDIMAYNMWGTAGPACPIMGAKRSQVYAGLYRTEDGLEVLMEQRLMDMRELARLLNRKGEKVTFLGDGVPVHQKTIEEEIQAPYVFASPQMNCQRAAYVAALGMGAPGEDPTYKGVHVVSPKEFTPEYLRKPQAERQREAEASEQGVVRKLSGDY